MEIVQNLERLRWQEFTRKSTKEKKSTHRTLAESFDWYEQYMLMKKSPKAKTHQQQDTNPICH